jgi:hypothetical protein
MKLCFLLSSEGIPPMKTKTVARWLGQAVVMVSLL